jgi:hypothetical protein
MARKPQGQPQNQPEDDAAAPAEAPKVETPQTNEPKRTVHDGGIVSVDY